MAYSVHSAKKIELPYKITLNEQIGRIAELFSTKLEVGVSNMNLAQRLLVNTQENAVNVLDAMFPYKDSVYNTAVGALDKPKKDRLIERQDVAMEKFGLLIELMKRNRMLMEGIMEDIEMGIEEEGGTEDTDDAAPE